MLDTLYSWIAHHLPVRLVYWCAERAYEHAKDVRDNRWAAEPLTAEEVLDSWAVNVLGELPLYRLSAIEYQPTRRTREAWDELRDAERERRRTGGFDRCV